MAKQGKTTSLIPHWISYILHAIHGLMLFAMLAGNGNDDSAGWLRRFVYCQAFRRYTLRYVQYYRRETEYPVIKAARYVFHRRVYISGNGGCFTFVLYFRPSSASRVITTWYIIFNPRGNTGDVLSGRPSDLTMAQFSIPRNAPAMPRLSGFKGVPFRCLCYKRAQLTVIYMLGFSIEASL